MLTRKRESIKPLQVTEKNGGKGMQFRARTALNWRQTRVKVELRMGIHSDLSGSKGNWRSAIRETAVRWAERRLFSIRELRDGRRLCDSLRP